MQQRFTRYALAVAAFTLIGAHDPSQWVEAERIYFWKDTPKHKGIFLNTHTRKNMSKYRHNRWSLVDLSRFVPPTTKAVYLSGLMGITHGRSRQTCNLELFYRSVDTDKKPGKLAQVVEAQIGGGQRAPHSTWVPAPGGRFEIKWRRSTGGRWPANCAYFINLSLVAFAE